MSEEKTFQGCELAVILLDPHELCGKCDLPASEHRNHRSNAPAPERDVFEHALATWGVEKQVDKAVEELGKLVVALMQNRKGRATDEDVITEIADVGIVLAQLERVWGVELVVAERARKIQRLRRKIEVAGV